MSIQSQFCIYIRRCSGNTIVKSTVVDETFLSSLGGRWVDFEALGTTPRTWNQLAADTWNVAFPTKLKLIVANLKNYIIDFYT